jgi:hypothetical protein
MNDPRQKYSIYRDNDLVASDLPSLISIMKFGSLGFKRQGSHLKGRMVWDG